MSQHFNLSRKNSYEQFNEVVGDPPATHVNVFTPMGPWHEDTIRSSIFGPPNPELLPPNNDHDEDFPNPETPSPPFISEFINELRNSRTDPALEECDHKRIIHNVVDTDDAPITLKDERTNTYFDLGEGNP